jgi:hypothetical protein
MKAPRSATDTHVGKKPSPALPASFPKSENRPLLSYCSKFTTCNDTFIEKLTEVQQTVEQLLAQLQANEHDKFAARLYRSRRDYRSVCQRAGKSGKQIERCVISTFQVAESLGFKGEFRQWEHLLRVGD